MELISQPLVAVETPRRGTGEVWGRLLAPSLADFFFVALLAWLFAAGASGWLGLLVDGDTGWHIRTGEYVLDHGRAPAEDLFSYSKPGQTWYAWEWLADVLLALLYRLAGLKAVVLMAGVVLTATSFIVFRAALWHGANPLMAMLVCLLGVGASSIHNLARPHIFTLLLMAISVWLLARDRRDPDGVVWVLVPLTALWTNLHGGFIALVATVALLAAGSAAEAFLLQDERAARLWAAKRYAMLAGGCVAASLINPFGIHLHVHVAQYLKSDWIRRSVQEFQSPSFREESMLQFEVLLIAGLFLAADSLRRRRVVDALWIVFWTHAALGSVRHVPVFVVVAAPLIAAGATRIWNWAASGRPKKSVVCILKALGEDSAPAFRRMTFWAVAPIVVLALINEPVQWPQDFPKEKFPVNLVDRHRDLLSSGRVLTSDQWADYLIFRSYPKQRVFFDGRSDFYGPELGQQYIKMAQAHYDWEQLFERYRFDCVLSPLDWPLATLLKRHPQWRIVEDDGRGILFERVKTKGNAAKGAWKKSSSTGLMEWTDDAESTRGDQSG